MNQRAVPCSDGADAVDCPSLPKLPFTAPSRVILLTHGVHLFITQDSDVTTSYMEHLELLTEGIPRVLLVAGQRDAEVITMYS